MLFSRALGFALSPGGVCIERKHLLHVLEHVVEQAAAEGALLELSLVPVHGLLVGLEVAVKVCLLMGLGAGLGVGMVVVMVTGRLKVFEYVVEVEVEGLEVLVEVVAPSHATGTAATSSVAPS